MRRNSAPKELERLLEGYFQSEGAHGDMPPGVWDAAISKTTGTAQAEQENTIWSSFLGRRWAAAVLAGVLVLLIGGVALPNLLGAGGPVGDYLAYFDAERRVSSADAILAGEFVRARDENFIVPSGDTSPDAVSQVVYWEFRITERIKGAVEEGDTIHVMATTGVTRAGGLHGLLGFGMVRLEFERPYVIFLSDRPARSYYPEQYGDTQWILDGAPAVAALGEDGQLLFEAPRYYRRDVENRELETPEGSHAPFDLTLADLRAWAEDIPE